MSGNAPSSISSLSLTRGLVFHTNQYDDKDSYDDDEDHHDNSHRQPNDNSGVHTARTCMEEEEEEEGNRLL